MRGRIGTRVGCLAVLLAGLVAPARAELNVTIDSTSLARGGTGTINVYLRSDASPGNPDQLNNYGFELQITGPHDLQFSNPPGTGYGADMHYVFANDSGSLNANVSSTNSTNDTFIVGDSTASTNPVSLSVSDPSVLLASIALAAPTTSVNVGDVYRISLVPLGGNGSMAGGISTFFDIFDFDLGAETSAVPFTSTTGTVTITAGIAVPEPPSSLTVPLAVGLVATFHGLHRLRRSAERRPLEA
jgi:hypothetical protein